MRMVGKTKMYVLLVVLARLIDTCRHAKSSRKSGDLPLFRLFSHLSPALRNISCKNGRFCAKSKQKWLIFKEVMANSVKEN